MMANLQYAKKGDRLKIPAADWNAMLDVIRRQQSGDTGAGALKYQNTIRIRNNTGGALDQFAVVGIDGPLITPTERLSEFKSNAVMDGITPAEGAHEGKFAVLIDALPNGAIGRGVLAGAVQVSLSVQSETDEYAEIADGVTATLKTGATGTARILWKESGTGTKWGVISFPSGASAQSAQIGYIVSLVGSGDFAEIGEDAMIQLVDENMGDVGDPIQATNLGPGVAFDSGPGYVTVFQIADAYFFVQNAGIVTGLQNGDVNPGGTCPAFNGSGTATNVGPVPVRDGQRYFGIRDAADDAWYIWGLSRVDKLTEGTNIEITDLGNGEFQIAATGDAEGEANTASNLGGDEGLYSGKVGVDLQFKGLSEGDGILLTGNESDVEIAVNIAGIGAGEGTVAIFSGVNPANNTAEIKGIIGGGGVSLANSTASDIIIDVDLASVGEAEGTVAIFGGIDPETNEAMIKGIAPGVGVSLEDSTETDIVIDMMLSGTSGDGSSLLVVEIPDPGDPYVLKNIGVEGESVIEEDEDAGSEQINIITAGSKVKVTATTIEPNASGNVVDVYWDDVEEEWATLGEPFAAYNFGTRMVKADDLCELRYGFLDDGTKIWYLVSAEPTPRLAQCQAAIDAGDTGNVKLAYYDGSGNLQTVGDAFTARNIGPGNAAENALVVLAEDEQRRPFFPS